MKQKIVIAPNSFKGSLSAIEICNGLEKGIKRSLPDVDIIKMPVADGGDNTLDVLLQIMHGKKEQVIVHDPLNREINAEYGILPNKTAIIEMACALGLRLLKKNELNPLITNTLGTGELILDAINKGYRKIILGIGGSATVDGGCGILKALGVKLLDKNKKEIKLGGGYLTQLGEINLDNFQPLIRECEINILCDVNNPLLGENGAARVFAPQKGASLEIVEQLEDSLKTFNLIALKTTGKDMSIIKYGGAAGGISASLSAFCNAKIVTGIDFILDYIDINKAISSASLVITSEGKLDNQTSAGKAPFGVALRAKKFNKPVIFIGGHIPIKLSGELNIFDAAFSIINGPQTLKEAIKNSPILIEEFGYKLGKILSININ